MKIALCFSGQARSFKKGFEYYKRNLLDFYDVDIFIHSWKSKYEQEILDLYKPVKFLFEEPLSGDFDLKYPNTPNKDRHPSRFTVSMLYSVQKSCELKCDYEVSNDFKYDWVIKSRTDFALNGKIPFDKAKPGKLYIPNCITVESRDFGNDQFAFGSSDVMNKRMTIYTNMDRFYSQGCIMIGEHMMREQIKLHGLGGNNLIYFDVNHPFPPGPYNSTPHSLIRDDILEWK